MCAGGQITKLRLSLCVPLLDGPGAAGHRIWKSTPFQHITAGEQVLTDDHAAGALGGLEICHRRQTILKAADMCLQKFN